MLLKEGKDVGKEQGEDWCVSEDNPAFFFFF